MLGAGVRIEADQNSIKAKIERAISETKDKVAGEYLKDANYFVRVDSGTMRAKSNTDSDLKNGLLIWDTPYAKRVYYTGTPSKDNNANAELMWADLPRQRNPEKYADMWTELLKK